LHEKGFTKEALNMLEKTEKRLGVGGEQKGLNQVMADAQKELDKSQTFIEETDKKLGADEAEGRAKTGQSMTETNEAMKKFNDVKDGKAAILLQQIGLEEVRGEGVNDAYLSAARSTYMTAIVRLANGQFDIADDMLNEAFECIEKARRAKEKPEKTEEKPKDEKEKEAPKTAATTKVNIPTEVYKWASAHPDGVVAGDIIEKAVKGKLYGYNLKVDATEAAFVKAGIKVIEAEIKEAKKQEKLVKKMDAAYGYHPAPSEPAKYEEPEKEEQEAPVKKTPKKFEVLDQEPVEEKSGQESPSEEKSEEETPAPKKKEEKKHIAKIRCPKCKNIMEIRSQKRPIELRCTDCNAKLLIK
jgi:DNA-directed RNA polymerase subunit RPC12/RpoP